MALNTLLSFAYHPDVDLAAFRRRKPCGRIMLDSGAYTAFTMGRPIRLADYASFLERHAGAWDHAVTLDVIGDPVATAANTRHLHAMGHRVMPVFTMGGSLAEFDAMVADSGYVCVGGLVGVHPTVQSKRIKMLQRRARDAGGGIHSLGIASMNTLRAARPYSADASTFAQVKRFGAIVWFDGTHLQQSTVANRKKLTEHREVIRDHGIDLGAWVRAGRMPVGRPAVELIIGMSSAYAAADEVLMAGAVPAPAGIDDPTTGTHLYIAAPHQSALGWITECDARLHSDAAPRVWRRYGARHVCTHTDRSVPA